GVLLLPCVGDGRQSGTSASPSILNASPEAAVGGGLALLQTGDKVRVDIGKRTANILITDAVAGAAAQVCRTARFRRLPRLRGQLPEDRPNQGSTPALPLGAFIRAGGRQRIHMRESPHRAEWVGIAPLEWRAQRGRSYRKRRCSIVTGRSARLISTIAHGEVGGPIGGGGGRLTTAGGPGCTKPLAAGGAKLFATP